MGVVDFKIWLISKERNHILSKYSEGTSVDNNVHDIITKRKAPKISVQFEYT